jgi:uncharacterized protein YbaA (DUF1428 family)
MDRIDPKSEETMARYVDGYLLPLPKKNLKAYARMARIGCRVWLDHGALEYRECVGEDLAPKFGVPYPRTLRLKRGETVVFSWIVYKSRKHRDRVNQAVMADPRLASMCSGPMPFDLKRMHYGGFEVLVEA